MFNHAILYIGKAFVKILILHELLLNFISENQRKKGKPLAPIPLEETPKTLERGKIQKRERKEKDTNLIELKPLVIRGIKDPFNFRFPSGWKRGIHENKIDFFQHRLRPFSCQLFLQNFPTCSKPMKAQKPGFPLLCSYATHALKLTTSKMINSNNFIYIYVISFIHNSWEKLESGNNLKVMKQQYFCCYYYYTTIKAHLVTILLQKSTEIYKNALKSMTFWRVLAVSNFNFVSEPTNQTKPSNEN